MAQPVNPVDPASDEADEIRQAFDDAVNMTAKELEDWLGTHASQEVGQKDDGGESTGHEMGRHIVDILRTKRADLDGEDLARMKKVDGYVSRHLQQRPDKPEDELEDAAWTRSLRNWGHDPLK
jgi:hypothetical protein